MPNIAYEHLSHRFSDDDVPLPYLLIQQLGAEGKRKAHPANFTVHAEKDVYKPTLQFAINHHLYYAEGIAYPHRHIPVEHAWCVDPADGWIIDPALPNSASCDYYGLVFDAVRALELMSLIERYGLLPNLGRFHLTREHVTQLLLSTMRVI